MTSLDTKISEVNYTLPEKCVDLKDFVKAKLALSRNQINEQELKSLIKLMSYLLTIIQLGDLTQIAQSQENQSILFVADKKWKQKLDSKDNEIKTLKQSFQNETTNTQKLNNEISKLNQQCQTHQQEINKLRQQIQAKNEIGNFIDDFQVEWKQQCEDEIRSLKVQIEKLSSENKSIKEDLKYKDEKLKVYYEKEDNQNKLNSNPQCQDHPNELFYNQQQIFDQNQQLQKAIVDVQQQLRKDFPIIETIQNQLVQNDQTVDDLENNNEIENELDKKIKQLYTSLGVVLLLLGGVSAKIICE